MGTATMETAIHTLARAAAWGAVALALAGAAPRAAGAVPPAPPIPPTLNDESASLDRRVSVDLDHVVPANAFRTFAQLAGLTAAVDAAVREPVTVRLENVRVKTLLDAVCESIGCRWEAAAGSPGTLHVTAAAGAEPKPAVPRIGLRDPVQLKVAGVDAHDLLRTFAGLLDAELALDPAVQGKVTLDVDGVPVQRALDSACAQIGCAWSLADGEGGRRVLTVTPKKKGA